MQVAYNSRVYPRPLTQVPIWIKVVRVRVNMLLQIAIQLCNLLPEPGLQSGLGSEEHV